MVWRKDPSNPTPSITNPELALTLPKCVFDGEDPAIESPGPKYLQITGTAQLSASDNDEVNAVLKNATSAV